MVNVNINSRVAFVQEDGVLTQYGVQTLLSGTRAEDILAGVIEFTQAELDAVAAQGTGTVTVHNDVFSAGSGQIITNSERSLLNTALQPGTPPEITRSGTNITLNDGEGGSSSVSLIMVTDIPFFLEDGVSSPIELVNEIEIPFFLEDGTESNMGLI